MTQVPDGLSALRHHLPKLSARFAPLRAQRFGSRDCREPGFALRRAFHFLKFDSLPSLKLGSASTMSRPSAAKVPVQAPQLCEAHAEVRSIEA
jgi:hypothetical protein